MKCLKCFDFLLFIQTDTFKTRFSNAVSQDCIEDAITLLDFASSASALRLYVVGVAAFKAGDPLLSDFRGVPLVDSDAFLKSVEFESESVESRTESRAVFPFNHGIVSLDAKPVVTVFTTPSAFAGTPAPCPDFSLVSEGTAVGKGYLVTIGTPEVPDILRLVFNALGFVTLPPGGAPVRVDYSARTEKRRKLVDVNQGDGMGSVDHVESPASD